MDKERFSTLLKDPSQVSNADIKALNEYRKKYPYFQSLYVVVAKALKDREHPKTEAFIKKAAIYSANRSHLKEIIEGDFKFPEKAASKTQETAKKPVIQEEVKSTEKTPQAQPEAVQNKAQAEEKAVPKKEEKPEPKKEEVKQKLEKEKAEDQSKKEEQAPKAQVNPNPTAQKKEEPKAAHSIDHTQEEQVKIDRDLAEIEAAKRRIEALLSGQVYDEDAEKKSKKPVSEKKKNQIEIIEKFIQNEPQIDRLRMAEAEGKTDIEDLADKSLLKDEAFETETLAKLMVRQGKLQRAEDIYKKLSLKFPEKSAYFATQIEKLKSK